MPKNTVEGVSVRPSYGGRPKSLAGLTICLLFLCTGLIFCASTVLLIFCDIDPPRKTFFVRKAESEASECAVPGSSSETGCGRPLTLLVQRTTGSRIGCIIDRVTPAFSHAIGCRYLLCQL